MKKNVAILVPQLANGGAERIVSYLSIYLNKEKFQIYVVVYDANEKDYGYNGQLIDLNAKALNNPIGKLINLFKRIYKMRKFKKKYNIDTTISFLSGPNVVNILSKRNDKVLISVRNFITKSSNGFYGKIYKILIRKLYNKSDKIIQISKGVESDLLNNYNIVTNKSKVIYNLCDIQSITKLSKESIENKYQEIFNKPTVINMGRLVKQKGQWHLIRAFTKVKKEIDNAQLVILGNGELQDYLASLTNNLDLKDNVHFLGFQDNPFKYIANSTIYVFTSLYEGFGNALTEAMACKVPVISSDCKSGPREILAPQSQLISTLEDVEYAKYGILTPVCDGKLYGANDALSYEENILADVIVNILKNKKEIKRYSERAYKRVNDFKIENIIKEWENEI